MGAPGCAPRRLRAALDARIAYLAEAPTEPPPVDRFPVGAALSIDAAGELVRRQILRTATERELDSILLSEGVASLTFTPDWDAVVVELRRAPDRGEASVDLLVAVPGTVAGEAGPLAVEQGVRIAALLPIELGARVLESGGVELVALLTHPDGVRVSVQLPAFPPGTGALVSGAAQSALRESLRAVPLEAQRLAAVERLVPEPDLLPVTDATVLTFPGGSPILFVGLHTALPTRTPPGVVPGELEPAEGEDWVVRIDQEPLGTVLARAALGGHLGGGLIAPPDRPDLTHLHLDGTGFVAHLRIWRFRPPPGTHDVEASGSARWDGDHLVLRIEALQLEGKGEVAKKRLPWEIPLPPTALPWPLERLDTIDGALVAGGRIPPEE